MTDNSEQQTSTTPTKPKKGFFGYAWRTILWFLVILYFALGAAWLGARYCLAPYLNEHKSKIENKISQVLDIPVQFGSLDTDWQGLSPEITLKNIELGEPGKDPITAESLTAKLSLSSLTNLAPVFESVTLNKPKVEVRRLAPMSFSVLGRKVNLKKLMSGETETHALTTKLPSDVMLLLKQKSLEIKDGTILVHDQKSGKTLEIKNVNAAYNGSSRDKQFAFTLTLPPEIASPITVRALFKTPALNPSKLADWDAELYAQTDFINFGELAKWMPDFSFKYKGTGSGSLWANFVKWSPSSASFIGALSHVDLQLPDLAPLRLKFIKGKVSGNMSDKAYGLSTENFSFELESGEKLPPLDMSLKLDRDGKEFTGFDMDLTARENIYLNGTVLGYTPKYIDSKFDDIVEFSELQEFLDVPLKNYSSGMVARLAFAVATMTKPDILIADEILSVGDFLFQEKCEKRMAELLSGGTTVILVSHSIEQIERMCNKVAWLDHGHLRRLGPTKEVTAEYRKFEKKDAMKADKVEG